MSRTGMHFHSPLWLLFILWGTSHSLLALSLYSIEPIAVGPIGAFDVLRSEGHAVNRSGTVAGVAVLALPNGGDFRGAFRGSVSGGTELLSSGSNDGRARDINNLGVAVGQQSPEGAVLWSEDGTAIDLDTVRFGDAKAINNSGQVVGSGGFNLRGFIWDETSLIGI